MDTNQPVQPDVLSQSCESRQALDRIADKWTALVFYALVTGPKRHSELGRTIEGISQKMLTQTLRSMEHDGLVERRVLKANPPAHVEYALTPLGGTLSDPMLAICRWAMEHLDQLRAARASSDGQRDPARHGRSDGVGEIGALEP